MSNWKDYVGDFSSLRTPKASIETLKCIYKTALYVRKNMLISALDIDPEYNDPHDKSLSLDEEKAIEDYDGEDKKNRPKPKYTATVSVQEEVEGEDGKKKKKAVKGKKITAEKNKAKWFTASLDFKTSLAFLTQRFVKELKDFYESNGNKFPDESVVLSELDTYGSQSVEPGMFNISPFILGMTERIHVNKWCEPTLSNIGEFLYTKLSEVFKDSNGAPFSGQLHKFIGRYVQFLKLIGVHIGINLYYKKLKADSALIIMILRGLEVIGNHELRMDEMFYKVLSEWIAENDKIQSGIKAEKRVKTDAAKSVKANTPGGGSTPDAVEDTGEDVTSMLDAEDDNWDEEVGTGDTED